MGKVVEYVWLGGNGELRSKARTWFANPYEGLPDWNYDGSSTAQAEGNDSEVIIKPRTVFKCPFRKNGYLVMCDTYKPNGEPLEGNNRHWANQVFEKKLEAKPWFGLEQEYFLISRETGKPLGFPKEGYPNPQGQYYCSVGAGNAIGREIADEHYQCCLDAGITISGINAEVAPGQWEFQVGPVEGILAGDHLWMARYLLQRVTEKHDVLVNIEPKPVLGDWNGSGCHTNFSTDDMRNGTDDKTGLELIDEAIEKLSLRHNHHMKKYGTGNELRMTGAHETSRYDQFSFGRANRGASVRIPNSTIQEKKGYFEDRRPSSNCDPYLVTGVIFETTTLLTTKDECNQQ